MKQVRYLLVLLSITLCCNAAFAQKKNDTNVRAFEFEVGVGFAVGSKDGLVGMVPGPHFLIEARTNLKDTPWDLGFQLAYGGIYRKDGYHDYVTTNRFSMVAFTDYNFRYWDKVCPFAGIGLGRTTIRAEFPDSVSGGTERPVLSSTYPAVILNPRIGVEFFNHLRLTAEYKCTFDRRSSYFALNLGFAFGGGRKK